MGVGVGDETRYLKIGATKMGPRVNRVLVVVDTHHTAMGQEEGVAGGVGCECARVW